MAKPSPITAYTRFAELPELLTVGETCRLLRRSKNSVYTAIRDGLIPSVKVGERGILVPRTFFLIEQQAKP